MKTINISVALEKSFPTKIQIGRQGENWATKVIFDCSVYAESFGAGTAYLFHQRAPDTCPYPVAIEQDGNTITWDVSASDTEFAGQGQCELRWHVDEVIAKTQVWSTTVTEALAGTESEEVPEAAQGWVNQVLEAISEVGKVNEDVIKAAVAAYIADNGLPDTGGVGFTSWSYDTDTGYIHLLDDAGKDVIEPLYAPGLGFADLTEDELQQVNTILTRASNYAAQAGQAQAAAAKSAVEAAEAAEKFEVDSSLSVSGKAADAAAVGGVLSQLTEEIANVTGVSLVEPAENDIPKVFIDGEIPTTKTDVLAEMKYISKSKEFHAYIKIKCQGTSSMSYPKKNFSVKLYSDEARATALTQTFRDWGHASNKFVLKANYIDHSHARNIVSANLWSEIVGSRSDYASLPEEMRTSPRNGAVDGFPIKVYTNGTYQGIYTWNIGKDAWMWGMDESNANHVLLCGETNTDGTYAENACNFRALWGGVDGTNWSVEVGTNSTLVKDSLNALISCVMNTTDDEFRAQIGTYLDLQSAIDYYLFQYAICGLDGLAKNMLLGTYDLVKWYCGAYDMDSTFGLWWNGTKYVATDYACPEDYQEQFSLLWERIEKVFVNDLKERYSELRQSVYSISNMFTHFERFMDIIGSDLYAEDLKIYTGIPSGSTNNITQIRNYIRDRLTYCDAEFEKMRETIPATGISLNQTSLSFTDTIPITLTATVEPSDTTDPVIWSSSDEAIVTVVDGVVTPLKNGQAVITATAGSASASCTITIAGIVETFTITRNLTNCTSSSEVITVESGSSHIETLSPNENFTLDGATITVTMGGIDISSSYNDGTLNIESVTGNIVITVVAAQTGALYPLVNGTLTIGSYTVSITNGNHVALDNSGGTAQMYCPISDITRLADATTFNNSSNNQYIETNFVLKSGDVIRLVKTNVSATIPDGYTSLSRSSTNLMTKTGEFKLSADITLDSEYDYLVTVSSDLEVDGLILWHAISGKFSCEFDIELYVNDIRYV